MGRKYSGNRRANIHLQHIRHRRATETQIRCFNFKIRVEIAAHYVNFAHCGVCSIYYSHMSACRYDFSIKIRQTHIINARMFYNTHTHTLYAHIVLDDWFSSLLFFYFSLSDIRCSHFPPHSMRYIYFFFAVKHALFLYVRLGWDWEATRAFAIFSGFMYIFFHSMPFR